MKAETATELLKLLVSHESITPDPTDCQKEIAARLEAAGFACEEISFPAPYYGANKKVKNLWATYGKPPYFVFCGHTDVVPPGDEASWSHPPFKPTEKDGKLYGRGTVDMKGSIAAMLIALREHLKKHGAADHPGLAMLITGDEEGEAELGTKAVLQELQKRGVKMSQCLVGEPTSASAFGDTIKNGRRGSQRVEMTFQGPQLHPGYSKKEDNVLHRVIGLASLLLAEDWDALIPKPQKASPPGTAFNIVEMKAASAAENLTSPNIFLAANWRYAPELHSCLKKMQSTTEKLIAKSGFKLLAIGKHKHKSTGGDFVAKIKWCRGAVPYYSEPQTLAQNLQKAINETQGVKAEISTSGGTSDGRFFPQYGVAEVVEFGTRHASIHCVDEHLELAELEKLVETYSRFLSLHFPG